jgi:2-polyprenyl-3-methyl-5-hydroxy-6-metoxy-1,4-benzoquinol methylase
MFRRLILRLCGGAVPSQPLVNQTDDSRVRALEVKVDYLSYEISRQASLIRYLAGDSIHHMPIKSYTRDSFDFQWRDMPDGNWIENRPEIKEREPKLVCKYTGLPSDWFAGKEVLDAGCGSGRFSWSMASMGAMVTAVDQSEAGVGHTRAACAEFGDRVEVIRHNLLEPLPFHKTFDLVWSFGVLHHTGDTYRAFRNVARHVKPGGLLFMMIYGEPRLDHPGDYYYYAEVERLRRLTRNRSFAERWDIIKEMKSDDDPGGWFDAVSPDINDLYSWGEIEGWLLSEGFVDVHASVESSNHFIVGRRPEV